LALEREWDKRVEQWHTHVTSAAAFEKVLDGLLDLAAPQAADECVDLGAGTGFVTTAIAPLVSSVLAVDISPAMAKSLAERAADAGLRNVLTEVSDLKNLKLPAGSADLIVSSYALHHLVDSDKRELVAQAATWLRPGGRLVIADMMFGRGGSPRDRQILHQKVIALAAKGPGGWWRIAKTCGSSPSWPRPAWCMASGRPAPGEPRDYSPPRFRRRMSAALSKASAISSAVLTRTLAGPASLARRSASSPDPLSSFSSATWISRSGGRLAGG
jgi:SAM-dependent methyltransferase